MNIEKSCHDNNKRIRIKLFILYVLLEQWLSCKTARKEEIEKKRLEEERIKKEEEEKLKRESEEMEEKLKSVENNSAENQEGEGVEGTTLMQPCFELILLIGILVCTISQNFQHLVKKEIFNPYSVMNYECICIKFFFVFC